MTSGTYPKVLKANGEYEQFDPKKLRASLARAGAQKDIIEEIVSSVISELKEGMSTKEMYRLAFGMLRKKRGTKPVAIKYSLRRAIAELGPSGYPFETFFGEILRRKGYDVRVGVDVRGWCAPHEVDVSARKNGTHTLVECKFHNNHALRSDLKTVLYVHARFEDIEKRHAQKHIETDRFHEAWLVTNTKFTANAISYASCVGMTLIGWGYPKGKGLRELVEETNIYPITVLPGLSRSHREILLEQGIVTCADLAKHKTALTDLGLSPKRITQVYNEMRMVCPDACTAHDTQT